MQISRKELNSLTRLKNNIEKWPQGEGGLREIKKIEKKQRGKKEVVEKRNVMNPINKEKVKVTKNVELNTKSKKGGKLE